MYTYTTYGVTPQLRSARDVMVCWMEGKRGSLLHHSLEVHMWVLCERKPSLEEYGYIRVYTSSIARCILYSIDM